MSLPTLPPNLLATIITTGQLDLRDIASLRLLSRSCNTAFSHPDLCSTLLSHFFPFAQETYDVGHRSDAFDVACNRLHRLKTGKWSLNWEVTFPPATTQDGRFPPEGFRLVDTDSDEGYFLTAYVEEHLPSVRITVRNLITGQDVHVSVPHEDLTGIYMSRGKVLLVYDRDKKSSIFIISDCREGGDGRTLWSTSVNTTVFHGIADSPVGRRRLQPVFNDHYIAFLNTLTPNGDSTILILRFSTTELLTSPLRLSPSTTISLTPDTSGHNLLAAERFPHHKNLHRIVLINALTGTSTCAYHFHVSPQFSSPERDMDVFFSPDESTLILWGSVRSAEYRRGILGQIMIFPIASPHGTKIRYLRTPDHADITAHTQTRYSPSLGIVWYHSTAAAFSPLNLGLSSAGTGALLNQDNLRGSLWTCTPSVHSSAGIVVGRCWVCAESVGGDGEVTVEMLRVAEPPEVAPGNMEVEQGSKRSSWFLSSTAGGSSAASVFGVGEAVMQVDAGELAVRLKEVEGERREGRSWGEVKRGWKEKLLGVWR